MDHHNRLKGRSCSRDLQMEHTKNMSAMKITPMLSKFITVRGTTKSSAAGSRRAFVTATSRTLQVSELPVISCIYTYGCTVYDQSVLVFVSTVIRVYTLKRYLACSNLLSHETLKPQAKKDEESTAEACKGVTEAADSVKEGARSVKNAAETVTKMTKEVTKKVSETAETITDKAASVIKDKIVGK
ncbi:hypothetical protein SADUNF_Sadunf01G0039800 [Salix dunnii]|uniref:Uncharacterized protein n=1 Tax=Salix dunnii TaxID=1413687 RepID=A0A835TJ30_9ROSI|nr:hypothetical protein SADUNF_Sadunf01G0039800 [Salix dunnii]